MGQPKKNLVLRNSQKTRKNNLFLVKTAPCSQPASGCLPGPQYFLSLVWASVRRRRVVMVADTPHPETAALIQVLTESVLSAELQQEV